MKARNKVVVAYQPLSKTLVVGELNKEGTMFIGEKYEVEMSALSAVAECLVDKEIQLHFEYRGVKKILKVVDDKGDE